MVVCAFNLGILGTEGRYREFLASYTGRPCPKTNHSFTHPSSHSTNQPTSQLTSEVTNQQASQLTCELTNQPASQLNSNKNLNLTKQPPPKGHGRKRHQRITTESGPAPLKGPLSVHLTNIENDCIS